MARELPAKTSRDGRVRRVGLGGGDAALGMQGEQQEGEKPSFELSSLSVPGCHTIGTGPCPPRALNAFAQPARWLPRHESQ